MLSDSAEGKIGYILAGLSQMDGDVPILAQHLLQYVATALSNFLKIPAAGSRNQGAGVLESNANALWSRSNSGRLLDIIFFNSGQVNTAEFSLAGRLGVRCIQD